MQKGSGLFSGATLIWMYVYWVSKNKDFEKSSKLRQMRTFLDGKRILGRVADWQRV